MSKKHVQKSKPVTPKPSPVVATLTRQQVDQAEATLERVIRGLFFTMEAIDPKRDEDDDAGMLADARLGINDHLDRMTTLVCEVKQMIEAAEKAGAL